MQKCGQCGKNGHNRRNCPELKCSYCDNSNTHVSKDCPLRSSNKKVKDSERHLVENMNEEQINLQRKRDRVENMNEKQINLQRQRDTLRKSVYCAQ